MPRMTFPPPGEFENPEGGRPLSGPPSELRSGPRVAGETHVERLIREAMEAGEFDDLAGVGKPIPGRGAKDDALWWVREWVRRNQYPRAADQDPSSSE
jgi:hypothetical protein